MNMPLKLIYLTRIFFFAVPFSPFLFAAVIGLLLGLLAVKKNFQENVIET